MISLLDFDQKGIDGLGCVPTENPIGAFLVNPQ